MWAKFWNEKRKSYKKFDAGKIFEFEKSVKNFISEAIFEFKKV